MAIKCWCHCHVPTLVPHALFVSCVLKFPLAPVVMIMQSVWCEGYSYMCIAIFRTKRRSVHGQPPNMAPRLRVAREPELKKLYEVLSESASKGGRSFIKHSEVPVVQKAVLDKAQILNHAPMLRECLKISPKLSFKKHDVRVLFEKLWEAHKEAWKIETKFKADWITTMVARFRNMCFTGARLE